MPESGHRGPWPRRWGLGRRGGAAPCVVTLCERALGQLGSPRGLSSRRDRGAPGTHRSTASTAAPASSAARPSPARQVTQGRVGFRLGLARARAGPRRNPSAAGRALVLITPHPLAAGVTSATPAPSSSFQKRRLPQRSHSQMAGSAATGPAPSRRRSRNCGCGSRPDGHASAEAGRKCSRPRLPPRSRTKSFVAREEPEEELFCRGPKPEAAFPAERPLGEEWAAAKRGENVSPRGSALEPGSEFGTTRPEAEYRRR